MASSQDHRNESNPTPHFPDTKRRQTIPYASTMPDAQNEFQGTHPSQVQQLPYPRRTSPENSVSLGNRRTTRDASLRASAGSDSPDQLNTKSKSSSSARRNSSGESHDTGQSDPKKWFDQSNKNPTATFDSHAMDGMSCGLRCSSGRIMGLYG